MFKIDLQKLLAQIGMRWAQFVSDTENGLIQTQARIHTDGHQIQSIGEALRNSPATSFDCLRQPKIGDKKADDGRDQQKYEDVFLDEQRDEYPKRRGYGQPRSQEDVHVDRLAIACQRKPSSSFGIGSRIDQASEVSKRFCQQPNEYGRIRPLRDGPPSSRSRLASYLFEHHALRRNLPLEKIKTQKQQKSKKSTSK